jgi:ATP-dependent Clp protease adapter protein ClpS
VAFDDSIQGMVMLVTAAWAVVVVASRMVRTPHKSLSPESSIALAVAAHEAARRGHERVDPEHVLLAALFDREIAARVEAAGTSPAVLQSDLDARLAELPVSPHAREKGVSASPALASALTRASRTGQGGSIGLPDLVTALAPSLRLAEPATRRADAGSSGPYRSTTAGPVARIRIVDDDATTMDAVVEILKGTFAKSHAEALHLMLTTHHKGSAIIGEFAPDEADALAERATQQARWRRMPLTVRVEHGSASKARERTWLERAWRKFAG